MTTSQQPLDTSQNTSFSRHIPGLQLAIDSTSLGEFKQCPRKYFYSIVLGYQPRAESVHLTFGLLLHAARERYDHARAGGASHEDSLDSALDWALRSTWNRDLQRPWDSGDANKNRLTLVRSLVWYLDSFGENDPLQTVILANGKPAVELSFRFDSGLEAITGERVLFCGHLDRLATMNGEHYIPDIKTTKHTISPSYFAQYTPDNQFSMYAVASQVAFQLPVKGLIVDALQILVGGTRFQRQPIPRSPEALQEWLYDTKTWVGQMEQAARHQHWPQNDKACHQYGGCPFRPVCSRPPSARQQWLQADYTRRVWDPLQRRGDI